MKEAQRELQQLTPRRLAQLDGEDCDQVTVIQEVQALRDCIIQSEAAIHRLAPVLIEAAHSGKDLKLIQSAAGLQAVAGASYSGVSSRGLGPPRGGTEIYKIYEEEDEDDTQSAASRGASREYPTSREKPQPPRGGGKPAS